MFEDSMEVKDFLITRNFKGMSSLFLEVQVQNPKNIHIPIKKDDGILLKCYNAVKL